MLPRPTLPRPTLSHPLPRPSVSSAGFVNGNPTAADVAAIREFQQSLSQNAAPQVPAATSVVSKPAQPSAFVTQLIEYVAEPSQTVLPHGLSPDTDTENELPAFLLDESWVPTPPEPDPPPEPRWDDPYGAGVAPSELLMREHEQRSHGRPAQQPPTDLPHGQRPPRPKFK